MSEAEYCTDEGQVLADMAYAERDPDWDLNEPADIPSKPVPRSGLVEIVQLPIIAERLHDLKVSITEKTQEAMSLACSPETLTEVKDMRASLNRTFKSLEDQRKGIKRDILDPYERFEAVYKECVSGPFRAADADLCRKIGIVEQGIIGACLEKMQAYFLELIEAQNVRWLTWDMLNINISLSDAKQKTYKKARDAVFSRVTAVASDVTAIAEMPDADEIMVEYQRTLNLPESVKIVADRHRKIEAQRIQRPEWEARQAVAREAVSKVDAIVPPAPAPVPVPVPVPVPAHTAAPSCDPEEVLTVTFSVTGPRSKLRDFKSKLIEYCQKEGLKV